MQKRAYSLLFTFIALAVFAGCAKADFHVTINKDQSADLDYKVALSSQVLKLMSPGNGLENPLDEMKGNYEAQGYTVSPYRDGKYVGIQVRKHVEKAAEIRSFAEPGGEHVQVNQTKGLLFDTFELLAELDMSKIAEGEAAHIVNMMTSQIDVKFTLTLPIPAEVHNASRVLEGNTYQWDLIPGQKNTLMLKVKAPNVVNITIGVFVLALVIVFVLLGIRRGRKKGDHWS